jgi:hypothetical protein
MNQPIDGKEAQTRSVEFRENLTLAFDTAWEKAALAGTDPDVAWARNEMEKVVVKALPGDRCFEAVCPVCGESFEVTGRTPQPLRRTIRDHLVRNPPAGVEHAHREIGDRLWIKYRPYEVHNGPFRPLAYPGLSRHDKAHAFYVVLRRLNDGRFFKTLPYRPGELKPIGRPGTCSLDPWRKIPYFRFVDYRGFYIFDTDDPLLAATACNRLLDLYTVRYSRYVPDKRMKEYRQELGDIARTEKERLKVARASGWRAEKAFSVGMRYSWPPPENRDEKYRGGRYKHTFNIIDARGRPICSTDDCRKAAEFWNNCGVPAGQDKAGVAISGSFEDPEEIRALLSQFQALLNLRET